MFVRQARTSLFFSFFFINRANIAIAQVPEGVCTRLDTLMPWFATQSCTAQPPGRTRSAPMIKIETRLLIIARPNYRVGNKRKEHLRNVYLRVMHALRYHAFGLDPVFLSGIILIDFRDIFLSRISRNAFKREINRVRELLRNYVNRNCICIIYIWILITNEYW